MINLQSFKNAPRDAMKASEAALKKVRKALGYTYP